MMNEQPTKNYVKCPECDGYIQAEGRVSIPVYTENGEGWWDWDNAEMYGTVDYECTMCEYSITGTVDDLLDDVAKGAA